MTDPHVTLPRPRALLLDFGGVIVQTSRRCDGREQLVGYLAGVLDRAGQPVPTGTLQRSLNACLLGLKDWKNASSRRREPREMSHREIVADFLASDLPAASRAVLVGQASEVLCTMGRTLTHHELRPGIPELLAACAELGVRVGVVSNAHSGSNHRQILAELAIEDHFGVQVYSDEVGIRKPHPGMLGLAATALDVPLRWCWYVGDTQDRDVVAGRRAGVGAVLLTRAQHTDSPPFPVVERADAVFDTPAGVLAALRRSSRPRPDGSPVTTSPDPVTTSPDPVAPDPVAPVQALLLDHGGVVSTATRNPDGAAVLGAHLAALLSRSGHRLSEATAAHLVATGVERHRQAKGRTDRDTAAAEVDTVVPEVDAADFWADLVGADLPESARTVLRIHAADLMHRWYRVKSAHLLRLGVVDLLRHCHRTGVPVVMVSNTVSGRGVRERLVEHGIADLIGGYAFSDEVGHRKPDARLVQIALQMVDVPPCHCWFLGDQARTDAVAAQRAGIGHRVLVRGGKGTDGRLHAALAEGLATHLVDDPRDLISLLTGPRPDSSPRTDPAADPTSADPIHVHAVTSPDTSTHTTRSA